MLILRTQANGTLWDYYKIMYRWMDSQFPFKFEMTRSTFFTFHYQWHVWRAWNVRNCWMLLPDKTDYGFLAVKHLKRRSERATKTSRRFSRVGLKNSYVTCVLAGEKTWSLRSAVLSAQLSSVVEPRIRQYEEVAVGRSGSSAPSTEEAKFSIFQRLHSGARTVTISVPGRAALDLARHLGITDESVLDDVEVARLFHAKLSDLGQFAV